MSIVDRQLKIGERVLVVGLGKSGAAAANWLARQGARVTVSDTLDGSAFDDRLLGELSRGGIELELGDHRMESFVETDLIVVSPGVPLDITPLVEAARKGVPILGELEVAWRYLRTPSIAVTGTNGKSTVVKLIGEMLSRGGRKVFVGGNIDFPLTDYIAGAQDADYVVLEISSFQLDTVEAFSPHAAMILNISPDHLDRYADYEAYVRSKERIFENQGPEQVLILNDDDPELKALEPKGGPRVFRFGMERKEGRQGFVEGGRIVVRVPGHGEATFNLDRFALAGTHNQANVMAAVLGALAIDAPPGAIQEGIDGFKGLPHRMELIDTIGGVAFYNDSKATNIDAAIKSITSFSRPVVLIAGGRHKGSDYQPLVHAAKGRVKDAVLIGESSTLLAAAFNGTIPWSEVRSLDDAVYRAYDRAQEGDVVLLAPACSSFDMFRNYQHRGMAFQEAVKRLRDGT
ncbi:MAG: UDP-N-acetylmuramoyl-L-alanine--D-glutamate ligase [Deltaproteobacteria bacterium]|nr:MAG: UDP-N-acetylmuramoyl-L-alanine--D-glutamate ligase [Deltaproteobacteria bacterium]